MKETEEKTRWLSPAAIAAELEISESTVRRNIHTDPNTDPPAGMIRGIRFGRQLRVSVEVMEQFKLSGKKIELSGNGRRPARAFRGKNYFPDL